MDNRGFELLAPAGNLEIFNKVIDAGADAVYFGGNLFGARAYAVNFSMEDAEAALRYAHLHGAKGYLTVNTLLKNLEIEKTLRDYLKAYQSIGIDAVIVQDFGVLRMLREEFPDIPVHASTQMSICNDGAVLLKQLGVSRVVTAREISLKEIRGIYDSTGLQIETFVHGALCYCYSGQCLFSSMIGGRSGNRGRCAQPCRLPYDLYLDGNRVKTPGSYILSPKDLCGINDLKDLYDAGVYSLKIEGRMKQIDYASGVVSVYRRNIDRFLENPDKAYTVSESDNKLLLDLGNRCGFTDDYYYKRNSKEMISFNDPAHKKADTAIVTGKALIPLDMIFSAHKNENIRLELICKDRHIVEYGPMPQQALSRPMDQKTAKDKLTQLGSTAFSLSDFRIDMDDDIFIPAGQLKDLRRKAVGELEEQLILSAHSSNPSGLKNNFDDAQRRNSYFAKRPKTDRKRPGLFVTVKNKEQAETAVTSSIVSKICFSHELVYENGFEEIAHKAKMSSKEIFIKLPDVFRFMYTRDREILEDKIPVCDGLMASSYDGLAFARSKYPDLPVLLDHRMYTYSDYAVHSFLKLGLDYTCAPLELNLKELGHRDNSRSQLIIYGSQPLMITAGCMNRSTSGCNRKGRLYELEDRYGNRFPCTNDCSICTSTIYNSRIHYLLNDIDKLDQLGFFEYRMDFTLEDGKMMKNALKLYEEALEGHKIEADDKHYTKGHLFRGVE